MVAHAVLELGFGLRFNDLYDPVGLAAVDAAFCGDLAQCDTALAARLRAARDNPGALAAKDESLLMVELAPYVDDFMGRVFGIAAQLSQARAAQDRLAPVFEVKRHFVQKRAAKEISPQQAAEWDGKKLETQLQALLGGPFDELTFAQHVLEWQNDPQANDSKITLALHWAAWNVHCRPGHGHKSVLFHLPQKRDPMNLVPCVTVKGADGADVLAFSQDRLRFRNGFDLTDPGCDLAGGLDQVHYCILCHHQGKDSCSKGLPDRKTGELAKSAVGAVLAGCPLEEKISEMHEVRGKGALIGALAVAVVDNPLVAGTGHRICNDCMAACIYQGQNRDAVDIPQSESRTLKDVLHLPWGFEIYSLLTRWNPLNFHRPLPRPATGAKVLVVGLGPAGSALSHHLLQDGHVVVAVDGLKIEPLPPVLSGVGADGQRVPFQPIRDVETLWEPLGQRMAWGFGGVAEYGITVRWDKNFLKVIRLLLERRADFALYGGVRFGGTLTFDQAFALGFDHVALATGAGKPTILDMPNNLAKGVRQASDFLMGLQLTGAARDQSLANLQLRLPIVVIGGGLTAVDAATEALAYYPIQVERFLKRHEDLVNETKISAGESQGWSPEDQAIADVFLTHGRALRAEREAARREGRNPRLVELLQSWGGSTIVYRRHLTDSPSYRNFEELNKAFEEGIGLVENHSPVAVEIDRYGAVTALKTQDASGVQRVFPARTILVAAGTVPNTSLAREQENIPLNGKYFQAVDEDGNPVTPEARSKPKVANVLMSAQGLDRRVSFFGDLHPSYAGNVVSAMASAKQGYPVVTRRLKNQVKSAVDRQGLFRSLNDGLHTQVQAVRRLTANIVEVVIHAPFAANGFKPGQFYRLQNFETSAPQDGDTVLAMEGLALTGAWTDPDKGLVGLIVLEMGGSSNLVAGLSVGQPVVLMGPTGAPTEIASGETVLLAGGGLGNAVLFSIGRAFRAAGSKVLYFAGYRGPEDRFKIDDIEEAADLVVWCVDRGDALPVRRRQDRSFVGNIVQAMLAYGRGELGPQDLPLSQVDRIIAIGSDRMMAALAAARHDQLAPYLNPGHVGIGSINSPMQCMMKEICAQCLQRHRDPVTGKEMVVFTCFNQDQELDRVDFASLADRLAQNSLTEKQTRAWIAKCLNPKRLPPQTDA